MPLALLLQETFRPLIARTPRLAPWADVGDRIALVGQRMRTAYLVSWFGPRVPTNGNALRVSLVNLRELLAKAAGVRRLQPATPVDEGMAGETVSGVVGTLAGMTFSPFAQIAISISYLTSGAKRWYLAVVNLATVGILPLAAAALAPVWAATVPTVRETTRALADFYAVVTELAGPVADFWRQLTGPREEVRNPVLRGFLAAADGLAKLIPHLFGAAAWLLTRVAPVLPAAARAIFWLGQIVRELGGGIVEAVGSLVDPLRELFAPARGRSVIAVLGVRLLGAFAGLGAAFRTGFGAAGDAFLKVGSTAGSALTRGWENIKAVAEESIVHHPITKIGPALHILGDHIGNLLRLLVNVAIKVFLTTTGLSTSWTPSPLPPAPPPSPPWWPPFPAIVPPAVRPWSAIT
ncbi:MAG: hypothetical protein L0Y54_24375, partial [Sporichthyaceae bacterium]|nr:hypothetical protein [Sporichthyaceae bacterium]